MILPISMAYTISERDNGHIDHKKALWISDSWSGANAEALRGILMTMATSIQCFSERRIANA